MDLTVETIARLAVAASALSLLAAAVAVLWGEVRARRPAPIERDTGPLALVNFVGIAGFAVAGLVCAASDAGTLAAPPEPFDTPLRVVGLLLLFTAGALAAWGLRSIGSQRASQAEVRPDTVVVTSGAFGVVRHPLYLSVLLLWAGAALALLGWALAVGFLLLVPAFVARSRAEERLLERHFGSAYRDYARRVPMLLPGWRRGV